MKNGFFYSPPNANRLLQYVIHADWAAIDRITERYPDLMFVEGKAKDINDCEIMTTPLEYALHVLDMFTLTIFQKNVSSVNEDKFYEIRDLFLTTQQSCESNPDDDDKSKFIEMAEKWLQQDPDATFEKMREFLRARTMHFLAPQPFFNMQPFYWVYEFFLPLHWRPQLKNEPIYEFWKKMVGWAQWHLLPRHMLKQLVAGATYVVSTTIGEPEVIPENLKFKDILLWSSKADFAHLDYQFPIGIIDFSLRFNWENGTNKDLTIGNDFALARGEETDGTQRMVHRWDEIYPVSTRCAEGDLAVFQHLTDVRYQQVCQLQPGLLKRIWNSFMTIE